MSHSGPRPCTAAPGSAAHAFDDERPSVARPAPRDRRVAREPMEWSGFFRGHGRRHSPVGDWTAIPDVWPWSRGSRDPRLSAVRGTSHPLKRRQSPAAEVNECERNAWRLIVPARYAPFVVPRGRFELPRPCGQPILSRPRLPVPPPRRDGANRTRPGGRPESQRSALSQAPWFRPARFASSSAASGAEAR